MNSVEFIGMQGAGKSTLVSALTSSGDFLRLPNSLPWKWYAFAFVCTHLRFSTIWIATIFGQGNLIKRKLNMFFLKAARWQYARNHTGTHLLDESFLQGLLSLYDQPLSKEQIGHWLKRIPVAEAAVLVDRKGPYDATNYIPLTRKQAHHWQETFRGNLTTLVSVLEDGGYPIHRCVSDDPATCAQLISPI